MSLCLFCSRASTTSAHCLIGDSSPPSGSSSDQKAWLLLEGTDLLRTLRTHKKQDDPCVKWFYWCHQNYMSITVTDAAEHSRYYKVYCYCRQPSQQPWIYGPYHRSEINMLLSSELAVTQTSSTSTVSPRLVDGLQYHQEQVTFDSGNVGSYESIHQNDVGMYRHGNGCNIMIDVDLNDEVQPADSTECAVIHGDKLPAVLVVDTDANMCMPVNTKEDGFQFTSPLSTTSNFSNTTYTPTILNLSPDMGFENGSIFMTTPSFNALRAIAFCKGMITLPSTQLQPMEKLVDAIFGMMCKITDNVEVTILHALQNIAKLLPTDSPYGQICTILKSQLEWGIYEYKPENVMKGLTLRVGIICSPYMLHMTGAANIRNGTSLDLINSIQKRSIWKKKTLSEIIKLPDGNGTWKLNEDFFIDDDMGHQELLRFLREQLALIPLPTV